MNFDGTVQLSIIILLKMKTGELTMSICADVSGFRDVINLRDPLSQKLISIRGE